MVHRVFVLVVSYNSAAMVGRLVDSLASLEERGSLKVYILDNCSTVEGEVERLHAVAIESSVEVEVLSADRNVGFGAGVNRLLNTIGASASDFVWVLNPDTRVAPDSLRFLTDSLVKQGFDLVSPRIVGPDLRTVWYAGGFLDRKAVRAVHMLDTPLCTKPPETETIAVDFITGAAPFARARTWRQLGGFPEDYFMYWEDVEVSELARGAGLRCGCNQVSIVVHDEGGSSRGASRGRSTTYYYYQMRNRFVFALRMGFINRLITIPGLVETGKGILRPLIHEKTGRLPKFSAACRGLIAGSRSLLRGLSEKRQVSRF